MSEQARERNARILGKAVHPDALARLHELFPEARVSVQHESYVRELPHGQMRMGRRLKADALEAEGRADEARKRYEAAERLANRTRVEYETRYPEGVSALLTMNAPLAEAIPHPTIQGAWTVDDPCAKPGDHVPMFASKTGAEVAANKRNEQRRNDNEQDRT